MIRPLQIVSLFNGAPPPSLFDQNRVNRYLTENITVLAMDRAMGDLPQTFSPLQRPLSKGGAPLNTQK